MTWFPMQRGPEISFDVARKIHRVYSAIYHNGQTLERIAERGGFGWAEVEHMWRIANEKGILDKKHNA